VRKTVRKGGGRTFTSQRQKWHSSITIYQYWCIANRIAGKEQASWNGQFCRTNAAVQPGITIGLVWYATFPAVIPRRHGVVVGNALHGKVTGGDAFYFSAMAGGIV
jgi:hypothetical protein